MFRTKKIDRLMKELSNIGVQISHLKERKAELLDAINESRDRMFPHDKLFGVVVGSWIKEYRDEFLSEKDPT